MSLSCENKDDLYSTTFLPVVSDARVAFPLHYKRFSVKMFTFINDNILKDQVRSVANHQGAQACLKSLFKKKKLHLHRSMSTAMP